MARSQNMTREPVTRIEREASRMLTDQRQNQYIFNDKY